MAPPSERPEKIWTGTAVSAGVAHAVVHVLKDHFDEPDDDSIEPGTEEHEMHRLHAALQATRVEIEDLQRMMGGEQGSAESEIFETHLLILQDTTILKQTEKAVREKQVCVDWAYYKLMCKHMDALRGLSDAYLRERFLDIKDVTHRVMRHLRGELLEHPMFDEPVIVVAHDLTPSDTVQIDRSKVLGFAVETGSAVSHAAIIARSLAIPAVVKLHGICDELHSGDTVLLDGEGGNLILNPTAETLSRYRSREEQAERREDVFQLERHEPALTKCGSAICVGANAEFVEEVGIVQDSGAEEVGLFRTEFLHLENPDASEDELAAAYGQVVRSLAPKRVVFRTLDLGGDKVDERLAVEPEPNPFLGWRGIRLSLGRLDLFKRQIRALLRAATHGRAGIMFPMVSGVQEVIEAKAILNECAEELAAEGVDVPDEIEIGAMIEIPSAALSADLIAAEVDFLSLGTNDLIQYTIAVDRLNDRVAALYQPTHPAVLRLIGMSVTAARGAGIRIGMCGEMASDLRLTPLMIGLGLNELSVATTQIARVKHAVRRLSVLECEDLARAAQKCTSPAEILALSRAVADRCYPELFE
ncbi:MAG: phosphoenolpyruvate--protein phosphotransferase [Prosthecobacter sp.]|jgi:phosphotransferase system enzyme I (PtsI)|uniref:phosphoenolpyruvate--protein phosphotransferase n=1 Tax=Prosthecobacter sp. TaxID=1965333 RepID=UPI0019EB64CB|nr:phosphoenolpyruvate--protein phosphotransferase [Prosthecobacter sp.]MBE2283922.1 phosphoenolpyruvate--protein phosphotransferase [Prosthecobacter sp.]